MTRYSRQTILPEIGPLGQRRLGESNVLVVGAGGLGASLLPGLVAAGVGQLSIIDPDRVELSNLHRQTLFTMDDLGQPKATAAQRRLLKLNPDCRINAEITRLDADNLRAFLPLADIVVDAADSFLTTYLLSDRCQDAGIPLISASVLGRQGYVGGFCGKAPGYRAVFPDLPESNADCASAGVMGPVVATLGAVQAQMCLSVLLGHQPSPLGQMITVDFANWRLGSFRFDGAKAPEKRFPMIIGKSGLRDGDLILDLRPQVEKPLLTVDRARRVPAERLAEIVADEGQRVVLVCKSGLRAWRAAIALRQSCAADIAIMADPA